MAKQPTKIDLQEELEKTKVKLKEKTEESEKEINQIRKDASGIGITTVLYVLGLILVSLPLVKQQLLSRLPVL